MSSEPGGREAGDEGRRSEPASWKKMKRNLNLIKALEHPIRAQAFRLLVERGKMSPAEIGREIGERTDKVSHHCKQLVAYDCARMVEEKRVEGKGAVEHFYVATRRTILDAADWDTMDPAMGEAVLNEILMKIVDDYEASIAARLVGSDGKFHISRSLLILDELGIEEAMENSERWRLEQSEIEARSAQRRIESGAPGTPVSSSLTFFKMPTH